MDGYWAGKTVFVTGGASFIGSTLTDQLIARGVKKVRIVDDLTSGHLANIRHHLGTGKVDFAQADMREPGVARAAMQGVDTVFHLAADHGGRGYVDLHQAGPASNFFLDGLIFSEALKAKVKKVVFASSGCVYPNFLQSDVKKEIYLTEDLTKGPKDADNMYGWAKMAGELTLRALHSERGMKTASCRYFTVYGPRGVENHAVIAMIARAFLRQDPFEVWGTGEQIRNWTYVTDIAEGTIRAAERIEDGTAINLGTMERVRVMDAVQMVIDMAGYSPQVVTQPDKPTGPYNRVADNSLAKQLLDWEPEVLFADGLRRTWDWYVANKDPEQVREIFDFMLTGRGKAAPARAGAPA